VQQKNRLRLNFGFYENAGIITIICIGRVQKPVIGPSRCWESLGGLLQGGITLSAMLVVICAVRLVVAAGAVSSPRFTALAGGADLYAAPLRMAAAHHRR